jgi:TPR repeat protein
MNRILLITAIFIFYCFIATAFSQQSFEGTTKGCVLRDVKPVQEVFNATQDSGPWMEQEKGHKPTVAVVSLGGDPSSAEAVVESAVQDVIGALKVSKEMAYVESSAPMIVLKAAGLSLPLKGQEIRKARDCLLTTYDSVVFIWFSNGWLRISCYHARTKTQAVLHGFSIYFGVPPLEKDVAAIFNPADVIESIHIVLEKDWAASQPLPAVTEVAHADSGNASLLAPEDKTVLNSATDESVLTPQAVDFSFKNLQLRALLTSDFKASDILAMKPRGDINAVVTSRPITENSLDVFSQKNLKVIVGFNKSDIESGYYLCYIDATADKPAILAWDVSKAASPENAANDIQKYYDSHQDKRRSPAITTQLYTLPSEKNSKNITAILEKANAGDSEAQYTLSKIYFNGDGVNKDHDESIKWLRKAADKGLPKAICGLGEIYGRGQIVSQDYKEAFAWFQKAADMGYPEAQYNLGLMYDQGKFVGQNIAEATKWYQKAADQGYAEAQHSIAVLYLEGVGFQKDYGEALKWFQKAADQGHPKAQYNLGMMYYKGEGGKQDYEEAAKWLKKAALQKYVEAQFNLGAMYYEGQGVKEDYTEAVRWFREAAKNGDSRAKETLAQLGEKL